MDPNEALRQFHEHYGNYCTLAARVSNGQNPIEELRENMATETEAAAAAAAGLFEWLADGGFAPEWNPNRRDSQS